jgi:hypothetical protein
MDERGLLGVQALVCLLRVEDERDIERYVVMGAEKRRSSVGRVGGVGRPAPNAPVFSAW